MYNSGITALDLIEEVENEADISIGVPRSVLLRSINSVEQFLYTEVLREYITVRMEYTGDSVALSSIPVPNGAAEVEFDDIIRVFADEREAERSGASGMIDFPEKHLYGTDYNGNLVFSFSEVPSEVVLIVRIRPALKDEGDADPVRIPPEHLDLVLSKMRGDVYKIANEDGLAAKWLADYNAHLENFKVWAASRNARYGG